MRLIPFEFKDMCFLYYKNTIFYALKFIILNKTGDDAQIPSVVSSFLFVEICRIRGPPSFNLKEILD